MAEDDTFELNLVVKPKSVKKAPQPKAKGGAVPPQKAGAGAAPPIGQPAAKAAVKRPAGRPAKAVSEYDAGFDDFDELNGQPAAGGGGFSSSDEDDSDSELGDAHAHASDTPVAEETKEEAAAPQRGSRKNPVRSEPKRTAMSVSVKHAESLRPVDATQLSGGHVFDGHRSFEDLGMSQQLVKQLTERIGFSKPTVCQSMGVPPGVAGKDVLIKSETGSGKTLTYLLPIVHHLLQFSPRVQREQGTLAMILAPTHELCIQISDVLMSLIKPFHWLVPGTVSGGEKRKSEKARLRKGVTILVATPGRLIDHLKNTQSFNVGNLQWLVLDEADRLLDMGFEAQLNQVFEFITTNRSKTATARRQSILCSATLTHKIEALAEKWLTEPVYIDVDAAGKAVSAGDDGDDESKADQAVTPKQLVQHYLVVPAKWRLVHLLAIIRSNFVRQQASGPCKIIIFVSSCASVDYHYALLKKIWSHLLVAPAGETVEPVQLTALHGNMGAEDRRNAFRGFTGSPRAVLFATDVAARGLDLPVVALIVQLDPPTETNEYVHRVGRTARSGHAGQALLCLLPSEEQYLQVLSSHGLNLTAVRSDSLLASLRNAPPPSDLLHDGSARVSALANMRIKAEDKFAAKREVEIASVRWQVCLEELIGADTALYNAACLAFQGYVRSYATYSKDVKHVFQVRTLHFGHVAKSFGLKEKPSDVAASLKPKSAKDHGRGNGKGNPAYRSGGGNGGNSAVGGGGGQQKRGRPDASGGKATGAKPSKKMRKPSDTGEFDA